MTMPSPTSPPFEDLMTGPFASRERSLVEVLMLAVREQTERSVKAQSLHDETIDEADRSYSHALRTETQGWETDREAVTAKLERTLRKLEERFTERNKEIESAYQSERIAAIEKLNKEERAIDEKLKETVWLAETVFDSAEAEPRLLLERITRSLDGARLRATEIENEALRVARSYLSKDTSSHGETHADGPEDPEDGLKQVQASLDAAEQSLLGLRRAWLLKLAGSVMFLTPLVLIGVGVGAAFATGWSGWQIPAMAAGGALAIVVAIIILLRMLGAKQMRSAHKPVRLHLAEARAMADACQKQQEESTAAQITLLAEKKRFDTLAAREEHREARAAVEAARKSDVQAVDDEFKPRLAAWREKFETDRERIRSEAAATIDELDRNHEQVTARLKAEHEERIEEAERVYSDECASLERDWFERMAAVRAAGTDMLERAQTFFPAWTDDKWNEYHPPTAATPAIRFGSMLADGECFEGSMPEDERLLEGVAAQYELPAMLDFPGSCSLLIETGPEHRPAGIATLQNLMLRLLTSIPPGKLRFTIIDPVGLGQSFAGFMHLADYQESLVSNRIWTDSKHIEGRLTDLTEHMEKVIQKYLRNEFESIESYN